MPINVENLSGMFGKDVFSNRGVYCGKVSNVRINLDKFRVNGLVIEAARGSYLADMVGSKKGVIIPYQMIQAIGDIVIIKHISAPAFSREEMEESVEEEKASLPF